MLCWGKGDGEGLLLRWGDIETGLLRYDFCAQGRCNRWVSVFVSVFVSVSVSVSDVLLQLL